MITAGVQTIGAYPSFGGGFFNGYIDQLQISFNVAKTAAQILDDATLVAHYPMDCATFPAWDAGPNQMPATAVALISGDGGRVRQSYLFSSNSSYFQASGFVLLGQAYRPFSFALWIRPIMTNGGTILHVSSNNVGTGWCVPFIGLSAIGQVVLNSYNGTAVPTVVGPVLTLGHWVHIVQTYSLTSGMRLYVNGVFYGQSGVFTFVPSSLPMYVTLGQSLNGNICAQNVLVPGFFRGEIDEFYVYSRELTPADITALANP